MPQIKYRAMITRNSKKRKPPCRKRKGQTVVMDGGSTAVDESTTGVDEPQGSTCSKKIQNNSKASRRNYNTALARQFVDVMELFIS